VPVADAFEADGEGDPGEGDEDEEEAPVADEAEDEGTFSICAASSMDFMMAPVRREPKRMTPDWRRAKMVWMRYCWRARMVVTRM
jgi:hypothetical protein